MHVLLVLRPDARPPTDGEARLAAAAFAVRDARLGPVALPWPDALAARQLAAVAALVPGGVPGDAVWDGARGAALVLGAVTALLLAAVLHRLGCAGPPVALAVVAVGVVAPALGSPGVSAAAVAVPWLLVAALLCWRGRVGSAVAALAAVLAALTAPLVGAVLLATAAHAAAGRARPYRADARTVRRALPAGALGAAAVVLAALAAGAGPLAGAGPDVPTPVAVSGAVGGLLAVAAGWGVRWARPLLTPTVLALGALLVPGPGRAAAALLALVLVAAVVAVVVDDRAPHLLARLRPAAPAAPAARTAAVSVVAVVAVAVAVGAAAVPARAVAAGPAGTAAGALLGWAGEQGPDAALHAGPLERAELVAAGFPPARLRDLAAPVADGDVVVLADRSGVDDPPAGARCPAGTALAARLPRLAGAPVAVCAAGPPGPTGDAAAPPAAPPAAPTADPTAAPTADPAPATPGAPDPDRAARARVGAAMTANPRLRLAPAAADQLRQGAVDPRVMIVLAALTGAHTLTVSAFPAEPLEPPDAVRRRVLLGPVDGRPAADPPPELRDWLAAQQPPFAPAVVQPDPDGLVLGYAGAPPAGLLPGG